MTSSKEKVCTGCNDCCPFKHEHSTSKTGANSWEAFEATNPRATLLDGFLYFREQDVKTFFGSGRVEAVRAAIEQEKKEDSH